MELDTLHEEWQKLGYKLEIKDLDTLKPVAHAKANDVLITITDADTKVLTLNLITWTDELNFLIKETQKFLEYKKMDVVQAKIEENFETSYYRWANPYFHIRVNGYGFNFYSNGFYLEDEPVTPKTLKLINKIAKVLEWEVDE